MVPCLASVCFTECKNVALVPHDFFGKVPAGSGQCELSKLCNANGSTVKVGKA